MDLHKKLMQLKTDFSFVAWKHNHPNAYLVHFFFMTGLDLQIGYYEKESDTITTFTIADKVVQNPSSDVFKEEQTVSVLDFAQTKVSFEEAMEIAVALQKEKYGADIPTKDIVVLQTIGERALYNVTFITQSFHLLNIRIDASSGEVVSDTKKPLMDLAASVERE
jgi:uncharacterized membrane protein YkoI